MVSTSNNSSSKSKPTVPVKSTVQTTRNTGANQNIYNKPLKTTKPKMEEKKETRLENIDLNIDKSNQNSKNENKSANRNENIDQTQTGKIVVSEKDPIFITTRNGKRVRGDYEHYQEMKKEEPRILRIRRILSKIEENNKGNDKAITTFFAKKQKASPFHVQNVNEQGKGNILNQKGSYTFAEDSFTDKLSAGIAQLPYFNEGLKIENERYEAILKEINGREAIKNAAIQKEKEAAWMPKEQRSSVENKYVSFMKKEGIQKREQEVESQEGKEIAWIHPEFRTKEQNEIVSKIEKIGKHTNNENHSTSMEKAILLSASFEGAGYTTVAGNFDGQGVSMGVFQWNIGSGTLQPLLKNFFENNTSIAKEIFVDSYQEVSDMLDMSKSEQLEWAVSINEKDEWDDWKAKFTSLSERLEFQEIQRDYMEDYINQAYKIVGDYGLKSEKGLALALDIAIQNWDVKNVSREHIQSEISKGATEEVVMNLLAQAAVDKAGTNYKDDVSERKFTIVNGTGIVHGISYDLEEEFGITSDNFK